MPFRRPPAPDVAFDLLSDARRRTALTVLRDRGALGERALAQRVVARRHGLAPDDVDTDRVDDVALELWHVHLPRLDETALVDHDRSESRVEPGPALDAVESLLAYAEEHDDPPADAETAP